MNPSDHKAPAQKAAGSLFLSALALSYHLLGAHGETPSSDPPELPGETKGNQRNAFDSEFHAGCSPCIIQGQRAEDND